MANRKTAQSLHPCTPPERTAAEAVTAGAFTSLQDFEKQYQAYVAARHQTGLKVLSRGVFANLAAVHCENLRWRKRQRQKKRRGVSEDWLAEHSKNGCEGCGILRESNGVALAVDHCHETNQPRAVLCRKCNRLIGLANDNPQILKNLARILKNFVCNPELSD